MQERISINVRRSQLGRVRGAGSAKSGVHHWYAERVTAIALVPLTLWFIISMLRLAGAPYGVVVHWAGRPWNAVLLLALIVTTFYHMALGVQVVLEDYVHHRLFMGAGLLLTKAACWLLGLLGVVSVLRLAVL